MEEGKKNACRLNRAFFLIPLHWAAAGNLQMLYFLPRSPRSLARSLAFSLQRLLVTLSCCLCRLLKRLNAWEASADREQHCTFCAVEEKQARCRLIFINVDDGSHWLWRLMSRTSTTNKMSLVGDTHRARDRSNVLLTYGCSFNRAFYYGCVSDLMQLGGAGLEVKVKKQPWTYKHSGLPKVAGD